MSELKFQAIPEWVGPKTMPVDSPFRGARWGDTLDLLDRELRMVKAQYPVLRVVTDEANIKLDGGLRAKSLITHRGVVLEFDHPTVGVLTYSCARFHAAPYGPQTLADWQCNVRAIAYGLEALRKVDRYGIADTGQQYAGWAQLGSGGPMVLGGGMTRDEALTMMQGYARDAGIDDARDWRVLYKDLAAHYHPDRGGDEEAMSRINQARDLLEAA